MSGISKCKTEMQEFSSNKNDRMLQKRQELLEQEREHTQLKVVSDAKEAKLEELKKKLTALRRFNEAFKIEEVMGVFFRQRNREERTLNAVESLLAMQSFMRQRSKTNSFSLEADIKQVDTYKTLVLALSKSADFNSK